MKYFKSSSIWTFVILHYIWEQFGILLCYHMVLQVISKEIFYFEVLMINVFVCPIPSAGS